MTEQREPDIVMQEIIGLTVGVMDRMHAHFTEVTAEFGLSPVEGRALFLLKEPVPMGALAGMLRCDASYVTGISNRLEDQGLVERQNHPADRRVKNLVLTEKGMEFRSAILLRTESNLPVTAGLSDDQRLQLLSLLRISQRAISRTEDAIPESTDPDTPYASAAQ